jgi:mono/diheme cytochrome c family protein
MRVGRADEMKLGIPYSTWVLLTFSVYAAGSASDPSDAGSAAPAQDVANIEHCDEAVASGDFLAVFACGDELFETRFDARAGGGMGVGDGGRFTRGPRADLPNWITTTPRRETGPNASACNVCHTAETLGGGGDGAGEAGLNVMRDPQHSAHPGRFIQRNTPHLFGPGGLQRLAEEMSADLLADRERAIASACSQGVGKRALDSKGVSFGRIRATRSRLAPCEVELDTSEVAGVDSDLVIRPFQWKGVEVSIRSFSRGAFHNELGMSPVEIAGDGVDGDHDGVADEVSIADVTAMAVYLGAQPRPSSLLELDALRSFLEARFGPAGRETADELELPDLTRAERRGIRSGARRFAEIGCAECHVPSLRVDDPVFSEPSLNPSYREERFPAGQQAASRGVDPAHPISFDLTRDIPDNVIFVGNRAVAHLGVFERDARGRAVVRLYGDLRRHEMGPGLRENIDETGHGASVWMTKELWGLSHTGPWLHDGRATTISEAVAFHGGEAESSRVRFEELDSGARGDLLAFLENLVLFFPAGDE